MYKLNPMFELENFVSFFKVSLKLILTMHMYGYIILNFSGHEDRISDTYYLNKERFNLAHGFRAFCPYSTDSKAKI